MEINACLQNNNLKVVNVNIDDLKLKLRLYEIGIYPSAKIKVLNTSFFKKTILIQVLDSCFIIKSSIAKLIEVEYD